MTINYLAVFVATIVQFIIGAIWYGPVFSKLWGKIHGFDKLSKEEQEVLMKGVGGLYVVQFIVTIITTFVFALLLGGFPPEWNIYGLAGFFWIGFVFPTEISAVIFSKTESIWRIKQIAIMGGASLLCLESAAFILHTMA